MSPAPRLILLLAATACLAQPTLPREEAVADLSGELAELVQGLYAADPAERAYAAFAIGQRASEAERTSACLASMLGDDASLNWVITKWFPLVGKAEQTSPGGEAMGALVRIGRPAVAPLIARLRDRSRLVRRRAVQALGEIGDPQAVEPLIAKLSDKRPDVRAAAAEALGRLQDPRALAPLILALKDGRAEVQRAAVSALGQMKAERAVRPLVDLLADPALAPDAADALVNIGVPAARALIAALHHPREGVRVLAARTLGRIKDPEALQLLFEALRDEKTDVRITAAWALGQIGHPRSAGPLVEAVEDPERDVRILAVWALGRVREPRSLSRLIACLKDEDKDVRAYAALSLKEQKAPQAVGALIEALRDEERLVRRQAAEALREITCADCGQYATRWEQWWRENRQFYLEKPK